MRKINVLIFLSLIFFFTACLNKSESSYNGVWTDILNDKNVLIITGSDDDLKVYQLKKKKEYLAFETGQNLAILVKKDTVYAQRDADGNLIIENKQRNKMDGIYKPESSE
jgi:hypothetical protein